jgi:predicted ATP-grasp superfamily ATP-dependent carboligase
LEDERSKVLILLGFAEALSAPEVVWSLVDQGFRVIAFSRGGRSCALNHSRYVTIYRVTPPEDDIDGAISDLQALLGSRDVHDKAERKILFPLDDAALWLCSKVMLDDGWILSGPKDNNADLALDKSIQIQAALEAGFNVPETQIATDVSDLSPPSISYPIILKPARSVSPFGNSLHKGRNWICANRDELHRALSKWTQETPFLVQPFVSGVGEGIFGLSTVQGIRAWSAHRRLRMMNPHGSGSSACISRPVPEDLKPLVDRLITSVGWLGLFMIELLRDNSGKAWFMELNGRPWGSMALARRQGLEYPAWAVQLAMDVEAPVGLGKGSREGLVCRHLGRELMHPLFVLRGPESEALNNWPSFWKALGDVACFRHSDTFYNWRKDDPKVLISDCYYTFRDLILRRRS